MKALKTVTGFSLTLNTSTTRAHLVDRAGLVDRVSPRILSQVVAPDICHPANALYVFALSD